MKEATKRKILKFIASKVLRIPAPNKPIIQEFARVKLLECSLIFSKREVATFPLTVFKERVIKELFEGIRKMNIINITTSSTQDKTGVLFRAELTLLYKNREICTSCFNGTPAQTGNMFICPKCGDLVN